MDELQRIISLLQHANKTIVEAMKLMEFLVGEKIKKGKDE